MLLALVFLFYFVVVVVVVVGKDNLVQISLTQELQYIDFPR